MVIELFCIGQSMNILSEYLLKGFDFVHPLRLLGADIDCGDYGCNRLQCGG